MRYASPLNDEKMDLDQEQAVFTYDPAQSVKARAFQLDIDLQAYNWNLCTPRLRHTAEALTPYNVLLDMGGDRQLRTAWRTLYHPEGHSELEYYEAMKGLATDPDIRWDSGFFKALDGPQRWR